jgi:uncharacterized protein Usg
MVVVMFLPSLEYDLAPDLTPLRCNFKRANLEKAYGAVIVAHQAVAG